MNQTRTSIQALPPRRTVVHAEALAWLTEHPAAAGTSVITSLPDVSEMPGRDFAIWRSWFIGAARTVLRWLPDDGVAIFFQSDIKVGGRWIDKAYLVQRAAEDEGANLVWHKIVCRHPPGTVAPGRPSFSHMLCFARTAGAQPVRPGPDVLADAGYMPWRRAMGEKACRVACRFLQDETPTRLVVDPFCGEGSVLAVANAFGFEALGVDLNARRCAVALGQVLGDSPVGHRPPRARAEQRRSGEPAGPSR